MATQNQLLREVLHDIEQAHDLSLDIDHYAGRQVLVSIADKIKTALAQPAEGGEVVTWRERVEQRIHSWRQSFVNKSGDQLALDDFMDKRSIDDLIDYVLDEGATPPSSQEQAQQPATPEPVVSRNPFASRCYTMSESHLSGHRLIVGFESLGDAQDAHEWVTRQGRGDFTHPAPGVLDDVVRDAERYRWLRDNGTIGFSGAPGWSVCVSFASFDAHAQTLDSNIDAAMLAAKREN